MKKLMILLAVSTLLLAGCSSPNNNNEKTPEEPATKVVRLAVYSIGHVFNFIAEEQGYLAEEGISVEYVPVETDAEVFEGIRKGTIDIASNSGTNLPLQQIATGLDLTIFAGYLLTGCLPVFGRADAQWNGIEDLLGKTMACEPNVYAITGPLYDMGYNPLRQINWFETENQQERIAAVKSGQADFGLVGTQLNYEVINDQDLKILTYAADILPAYSCCRVEALSSWVRENPNTVKALLRAWIRAMEYYESHHDETVDLVIRKTNANEDEVRVYMDNPRHDLNIDPMKKSVIRAWSYMRCMGLMDETGRSINILDHINTDLYKQALDECQARYGADNQKFYENLQAQYARNNQ